MPPGGIYCDICTQLMTAGDLGCQTASEARDEARRHGGHRSKNQDICADCWNEEKRGSGVALASDGLQPGRWTPDEDDALRALYGTMPNSEVAERLGRSLKSVKKRIGRLELADGGPGRRWPRPRSRLVWTENEDRAIRASYGIIPTRTIAAQLERTIPQIRVRADQLGVAVKASAR